MAQTSTCMGQELLFRQRRRFYISRMANLGSAPGGIHLDGDPVPCVRCLPHQGCSQRQETNQLSRRKRMSGLEVSLITLLAMLVLIYLGMYVPVVLTLLSFLGVYFIRGDFNIATNLLVQSASKGIADFLFGVIPLFVLMG